MEKINARELKELFIEIKYGNKIAFEKLYNNYNNLIYRIAYSILKNKHDAEDVVQIVFEKLYLIDKEKLPNKNETSWLYSVTKNETINYMKRNKNNINLDSIYNIEDDNNDINKIIDQESYNRLISKLNDKEKEILSLKIVSNLSFNEIGKLLKEPTGSIKWRYYKSINTLKILLSNLGMFIITFVIGIKTLFNKKVSDIVEQDKAIESNTTEQTKENTNNETMKEQENLRDEVKSDISKSQDRETKEEINIVSQPTNTETINSFGVCILSISFIFLIVGIIFSIIFAKYQLKLRKRLSK